MQVENEVCSKGCCCFGERHVGCGNCYEVKIRESKSGDGNLQAQTTLRSGLTFEILTPELSLCLVPGIILGHCKSHVSTGSYGQHLGTAPIGCYDAQGQVAGVPRKSIILEPFKAILLSSSSRSPVGHVSPSLTATCYLPFYANEIVAARWLCAI